MLILSRLFLAPISRVERRIGDIPRLDKVRVLPDKESERGTWQRISRRRMDQSRNFASKASPPLSLFSPSLFSLLYWVLSPAISITAFAGRRRRPGISYPHRPALHLESSAPKASAEHFLKDYAVTHVLAGTLLSRRGNARYITVFRAAS